MALTVYDRIKDTSTTTGIGTYTLDGGAATGFQAFADAYATGDTTYYTATDGTDWEVALGTLTSGTPWTLARTTILASSNAGAAVNWAAGTRTIFCSLPASKAVYKDASNVTQLGATALTGVAGTSALTITDATQTTSKPVLDLSQTWNDAGVTFIGIKANFTSTASAAASLLLDLQVGGTSKAKIDKSGSPTFAGTTLTLSGVRALYDYGGALILNDGDNAESVSVYQKGLRVVDSGYFGFSSNTTSWGTMDVALYRDAANTLALRNSTNAQEFRTYGTYTSATQYHYNAVKTAKTTLTATAGATITATNLIPAGAFLIGVTTRVNTTCTTATGYTVGDGTDPDLWGVAADVAAGTATSSANFTAAGACGLYIAAQSVVITATGGNFDGTGAIEVVAHYLTTVAD